MRRRSIISVVVILLALVGALGCSPLDSLRAMIRARPTPTATPTRTPRPTFTPIPMASATPTPMAAAKPSVGGEVVVEVLNVRSGPSTAYDKAGQLERGSIFPIVGRATDEQGRTWYRIDEQTERWVCGQSTYVTTWNADNVAVLAPPPLPTRVPTATSPPQPTNTPAPPPAAAPTATPTPQFQYTGSVGEIYPNCGSTGILGIVRDKSGNIKGLVTVRVWAEGWDGATTFTSGGLTDWNKNYDFLLDVMPKAGTWYVAMVVLDEAGNVIRNVSNTVTVNTTANCQGEGAAQWIQVNFNEN